MGCWAGGGDNTFSEVSIHQNLTKTINLLAVQPLDCHHNSSVPSLCTVSLCSYVYCTKFLQVYFHP